MTESSLIARIGKEVLTAVDFGGMKFPVTPGLRWNKKVREAIAAYARTHDSRVMGLTLKWLLVFVLMSGLATAAETTLVERAQKGDADAQLHLGLMYATGRGVVRDSTEAVKWYRKAAEQGNATAQGNLGSFYANGEGVPKDAIEGLAWSGATSQPRQAKRFLSRIETTLSVA